MAQHREATTRTLRHLTIHHGKQRYKTTTYNSNLLPPRYSYVSLFSSYARCTRQTDRRQTKTSLNASTQWGRRHNNNNARKTQTVISLPSNVSSPSSMSSSSEQMLRMFTSISVTATQFDMQPPCTLLHVQIFLNKPTF